MSVIYMYLSSLTLQNFRNYTDVQLSFDARGAVITGANGAGKTNVLEAIHLLCTGRSQRGATRRDMVRFEQDTCFVRGEFRGVEGGRDSISIGFSRSGRLQLVRNNRQLHSLSQWVGAGAVVSFGPSDIALVYGAPGQRRRYLDILISQIYPAYLDHLIRYRGAMANRRVLLEQAPHDTLQLQAFEESMALSGKEIWYIRKEVLAKLATWFTHFYAHISAGCCEEATLTYKPSLRFRDGRDAAGTAMQEEDAPAQPSSANHPCPPTGDAPVPDGQVPHGSSPHTVAGDNHIQDESPLTMKNHLRRDANEGVKRACPHSVHEDKIASCSDSDEAAHGPGPCRTDARRTQDTEAWKILFLRKLYDARARDAAHGGASWGVHRDDIEVRVNNKRARQFASQGQCRSAAFALKMSAVACLEHYRRTQPIFLVDDVFSEMDRMRTNEVSSLLEREGQIFFASPEYREALLDRRAHYRVAGGRVSEATQQD
jgi:recombinational DNA repair ATPase RecF